MRTIQGVIKRRILINYQVDPDIVQTILPQPFRPKVIKGKAIMGVCQIKMEEMRPAFLSKCPMLGVSSENAAHRIAVEWDENGITKEGVYIFRRDTNSRINAISGGKFFPGESKFSLFQVSDDEGEVEFSMRSKDGAVDIYFKGKETESISESSVFSSLDEVSQFFKEGSDGYSPTRHPSCHEGLCLHTVDWDMKPFGIEAFSTSFFTKEFNLQPEDMVFDSALVMRDIQHKWSQIPSVG